MVTSGSGVAQATSPALASGVVRVGGSGEDSARTLAGASPHARSPSVRVARGAGLGLALVATSAAVALGWLALGAPTGLGSCGASGCDAAARSGLGTIFGVPVLAISTALMAVLWSGLVLRALAPEGGRWSEALHGAVFGLAALLLLGTAVYLVAGLALGVTCPLCLGLHGLALAAAIGVYLSGLGEPVLPSERRARDGVLVLGLVAAALWVLLAMAGASRQASASNQAAERERWIGAVCEPERCPEAALIPESARPAASLILASAPGAPTLLLWLDLECAACRREVLSMATLLHGLVATRSAGLEIVLRAPSSACDPSASGGDLRACEAPAAMVCATRLGGGRAGLDYLLWELSAAPGFFALDDRKDWLRARVDIEASRCLDDELRLGRHGELARHAEAGRALQRTAAASPGCGAGRSGASAASSAPWWCFEGTPSMAIITDEKGSGRASSLTARSSLTRELALGRLTGKAREAVLGQCLGGP